MSQWMIGQTSRTAVGWLVALGAALPGLGQAVRADAGALIAQGTMEVGFFNFQEGYNLFARAAAMAQRGSLDWQRAVFGQANCAAHLQPATPARIAEARRLFMELTADGVERGLQARAWMSVARIDELRDYRGDEIDLASARSIYAKLRDGFADLPIAGEAVLRLAATHIQTYEEAEVRKGIAQLEEWLAQRAEQARASGRSMLEAEPLAPAMWMYLSDSYFMPLDDLARSLACLQEADSLGFLEGGREGATLWRAARLAHRLSEQESLAALERAEYRATAIAFYQRVITQTPSSGKAYDAQRRLLGLGVEPPPIQLMRTSGSSAADGGEAPR